MASKRNVYYKCSFCDFKALKNDLVYHVGEKHEEMIPEGYTPLRIVFDWVNKKPKNYNGKCTECNGPTGWDESKGRYNRQCGKKACHDSFVKKFEENMMKTRGVTRISATEEGQKKMLANRKISGTYIMQDGAKKTYTGSYELKALEFMDKVMNIKSEDILCPGPILEYSYDGKTHIYITDFYYQPYNLIIEVKDGGNNPNKRNMPEYRAKQIAKEKYIVKHTNFNYLRLTDNNFAQLLSVFCDLKMQMVENTGDRVIHINENTSFNEMMNALMSGKVPGMRDSGGYIVNYPMKTTFSDEDEYKVGFTRTIDCKSIIGQDEDNILRNIELSDEDKKKVRIFRLKNKATNEAYSKLFSMIDKEVDNSFVYETLTGIKLYTPDQVIFNLKECMTGTKFDDKMDAIIYGSIYLNQNRESINESLTKLEDDVKNIRKEY